MQDLRIYQLIHRELTDQLSPQEQLELNTYKSHGQYDHVFSELSTVWSLSKQYLPQQSFDVASAKARFKNRMAEAKHADQLKVKKNWFLAAAIGTILIVAIVGTLIMSQKIQNASAEVIDELEYAILGDDSKIWTNTQSTVVVSNFKNTNERRVKLTGEAYFDVNHNADKPFIVDLGHDNFLEVLGTTFNLVNNENELTYTVHVNEGKVRLYNIGNKDLDITIMAGQYGIVNARENTIFTDSQKGRYSFFADDLKFNNTPLPQVLDKVGKYFNVTFAYDTGDLTNCKISSPLMDNFNLQEIFEVLKGVYPSLKFKKTRKGKVYKVSGKCVIPE